MGGRVNKMKDRKKVFQNHIYGSYALQASVSGVCL